MKVIVQPDWNLLAAIEAAYDAYVGGGKTSKGHRMSVLMTWANVVGRARAVKDLQSLYNQHGTREKLAEWLGVGPATLRRLDQRFRAVPEHTILPVGFPIQVEVVWAGVKPTSDAVQWVSVTYHPVIKADELQFQRYWTKRRAEEEPSRPPV